MLTGSQIKEEVAAGRIEISDFNADLVGPNSYDLHWGDTIKQVLPNAYSPHFDNNIPAIDMRIKQKVRKYKISEQGTLLLPETLYLIPTKECVGTDFYVPQIVGRSSIGRMGISICQEASFGDIGYHGVWTLQVSVVYPTVIYPNMRVCHVYFEEPCGQTEILYNGHYQNAKEAIASRFIE